MAPKGKKQSSGKKATNKQPRSKKKVANGVMVGLDNAAKCYARLLLDPCGAPLCPSIFSGAGGCYLARTRVIQTPLSGSNLDWQFFWRASDLYNGLLFGQTNYGATGILGTLAPESFAIANASGYRVIAGCVKARYIGSELNRQGTIGMAVLSQWPVGPGASVGTNQFMPLCPVIQRCGECIHEVKFVPNIDDTEFSSQVESSASGGTAINAYDNIGTTLVMVGSGWSPSSLQLEITAVYEYQPNFYSNSNSLVATVSQPTSRNTLNEVLMALGDAAGWAFSNVLVPVMQSNYASASFNVANRVFRSNQKSLTY